MKMDKIVVIGYGGHAKSVIDSIKAKGEYEIVGYTDIKDKQAKDIRYLGSDDSLPQLFKNGIHKAAFGLGFMGNSELRNKLYQFVKQLYFELPVIIDPTAVVSKRTEIGEGTFIGKRAVVNADAVIGKMCIINSGSIVEHENQIGDFTHIAVASVLCGKVIIGSQCLIGANSTVIQEVSIGNSTIIGAGSVVTRSIGDNEIAIGNPAKRIKK